jgi:hypothetical protein
MQVLFDQPNTRQPEETLDLAKFAQTIIAQAAVPYPDSGDAGQSAPLHARPD